MAQFGHICQPEMTSESTRLSVAGRHPCRFGSGKDRHQQSHPGEVAQLGVFSCSGAGASIVRLKDC